jgi:hypothetical protein
MYCTAAFHMKADRSPNLGSESNVIYITIDVEEHDTIVGLSGRRLFTDAAQRSRHMIDLSECSAISRGPSRAEP